MRTSGLKISKGIFKPYCFAFFLLLVGFLSYADKPSSAYEKLKKTWMISKMYHYGALVPKDEIKALAWQLIYINNLPKDYPQKDVLLRPFKAHLTKAEIKEAKELANRLEQKYQLLTPVSEALLHQGIEKEKLLSVKPRNSYENFVSLPHFIKIVSLVSPSLAMDYEKKYRTFARQRRKQSVLVFGQLHILGGQLTDDIETNISLGHTGFFLTELDSREARFILSGYQPIIKPLPQERSVINLGHLELIPIEFSRKASIKGQFKNNRWDNSNSFILLTEDGAALIDEPWKASLIFITRLASGEFYASHLKPGHYQLVIATKQKRLSKNITLHQGEVKNLAKLSLAN